MILIDKKKQKKFTNLRPRVDPGVHKSVFTCVLKTSLFVSKIAIFIGMKKKKKLGHNPATKS